MSNTNSNSTWTNIEPTLVAGAVEKRLADKPIFNAYQIQSHNINPETGNLVDNNILMYDIDADEWIYTLSNLTGPTGAYGPTGPTGFYDLTTITVATDIVNTGAQFETVTEAVDGSQIVDSYRIQIVGDTDEISVEPSWKTSADYHIEIFEGATWTLTLTSEITTSDGNLLITGPGTMDLTMSSGAPTVFIDMLPGKTLTLQNLTVNIQSSTAPSVYRTFTTSDANLIIQDCKINIYDSGTNFRYAYLDYSIGTTNFEGTIFSGPGIVLPLYDAQFSTSSSELYINNCTYTGPGISDFILTALSSQNKTQIVNTLINCSTGSTSLIDITGECIVSGIQDIDPISHVSLSVGNSNQTISYSSLYQITVNTNATGAKITGCFSEYSISVDATGCQLDNLVTDGTLTVDGTSCQVSNIDCTTLIISGDDNQVSNVYTNAIDVIGSNNRLSAIRSVTDSAFTGANLYVQNCELNESGGPVTIDCGNSQFNSCNFIGSGGSIDVTGENNMFSGCLFTGDITWGADLRGGIFSSKIDGAVTISTVAGATGPLFVGNINVPQYGPTNAMTGSIGNWQF